MIFDLVVLAAILISCLIAFLRGFIREVLTILGVIGGTAAAVSLGPKLTPFVKTWLDHHQDKVKASATAADKAAAAAPNAPAAAEAATKAHEHAEKLFGVLPYDIAAEIIAYGGVFIVVVIVLSIISHLLSGWAKKIGLGAVDRTLGIFFGVVRAVVLLGLLYLPVYLLADEAQLKDWFGDSRTRVYVQATSAWLDGFMPKTAKRDLNAAADKASASMAGATRDKLLRIDALKERDRKAGDEATEKAADFAQRLRAAGAALRGQPAPASQPAYSSTNAQQPGYADRQRGQMDNLIQNENAIQNGAAPAGKAGQ
jgi:membrane protein required for colicin V production